MIIYMYFVSVSTTTSFVVNIVDFLATASPRPTTASSTETTTRTSSTTTYNPAINEIEIDISEADFNENNIEDEYAINVTKGGTEKAQIDTEIIVGTDKTSNGTDEIILSTITGNIIEDVVDEIDGKERIIVGTVKEGEEGGTAASIEELFLDSSPDLVGQEVQNIIQVNIVLYTLAQLSDAEVASKPFCNRILQMCSFSFQP